MKGFPAMLVTDIGAASETDINVPYLWHSQLPSVRDSE